MYPSGHSSACGGVARKCRTDVPLAAAKHRVAITVSSRLEILIKFKILSNCAIRDEINPSVSIYQ